MATRVEVDVSDAKEFFEKLGRAARGDFKKQLEIWLDGLGHEFLNIVTDEIIRRQVVDSRNLLSSFSKGNADNVWEISDSGMTLEVGSCVDYAKYVNDGHWTNSKGVEKRFVPGYWEGDRFIYDPNAKGGMVLKQQWVEPQPYFDSALRILDKMMPGYLESKLQEWIESYF